MSMIFRELRTAALMLLCFTLLTGAAYPAAITLVAQLAFPRAANGGLLEREGRPVGAELIGQAFSRPEYFWGRLSATGPVPYNAAASSGSNYGPMNGALRAAAQGRIDQLQAAGEAAGKVPADLVTASASGLDPHISPAAAEFQVARVAQARKVSVDELRTLVASHTEGPQLGLLGEPRVNVLKLNLALDGRARRE